MTTLGGRFQCDDTRRQFQCDDTRRQVSMWRPAFLNKVKKIILKKMRAAFPSLLFDGTCYMGSYMFYSS